MKKTPLSRGGRGGARPGAGRPRTWQGEKLQAVLDKLREGKPLSIACRLQGHEPDSLEELMSNDVEMRGLVEQARAFGQDRLVDMMLDAGGKDGATVAKTTYLLGVLNPKVFRQAPQKIENEHTGKDGGAVAVEITLADAHELAKGST